MPKLIFLIFVFGTQAVKAWTLVIDPGHGGVDHGAVYSGAQESDLTLAVSRQIKELFSNASPGGFQVHLTRQNDSLVSLQERIQLAENYKADLIVSIHVNAAQDPRARGIEFFVPSPMAEEEESLFLAHQESQIVKQKKINSLALSKSQDVAAIVDDLHRQNKFFRSLEFGEFLKKSWRSHNSNTMLSIKQAPFYIISQGKIPATLIEIGFLSHAVESKLLKDPKYQKQLAQTIYRGIISYFKEAPGSSSLVSNRGL